MSKNGWGKIHLQERVFMIYNNVRHECNLYNFFFAPRGNRRMMELEESLPRCI